MSALGIQCPQCGFSGRVKAEMAGRTVQCRQCNTKFKVAAPSLPELKIQPIRQAPPETPAPEPPASRLITVPGQQAETPSGVSDDELDRNVGPDKCPALNQQRSLQRRIEFFIPIVGRISIVLGLFYVIDALRSYLNPFTMLPNAMNLVLLFLTGGIQAVLTSEMVFKLVLCFGIFYLVRSWWRGRSVTAGGVYGSAAWATEAELKDAGMFGSEGLLLGRTSAPRFSSHMALKSLFTAPVAESDAVNRYFASTFSNGIIQAVTTSKNMICIQKGKYVHLLTVAPAGAGKGVGLVIPNLLNYSGSVIVIDPKGENFTATAEHRRTKLWSNVLCLDPFNITKGPSATFNPFDLMDPLSVMLVDDVRAFAEALIVKTERDHDPYWNEQAGMFLQAVVLLVACHATGQERNLNMVRKILSNKNELRSAIKVMMESNAAGGMLARLGGQMDSIDEKEFSSILSSTNRHTNFLDSPLVAANVAQSSFDMTHLAETNTSLYLVLPPQFIRSHAGLMRLWVNCILMTVKNRGATEKDEILFILDEVAQLGQLQPLEDAVTLLRGYGVRMWFFLQSFDQLKVCFPGAHANVLLSNFGVQQFFEVNDLETANYITARVGKTTATAIQHQRGGSRSSTSGWSASPGLLSSFLGLGTRSSSLAKTITTGESAVPIERDLMRPEEVMKARDSVFIFAPRVNPILGNRLTHYSDPEFEPAISGTGLVTVVVKDQTPLPKVSRISYALALLGVLLVTSTVYSAISTSIKRQQMIVARQVYIAKQAELRKEEMERRRLNGEEPRAIKKQQTRRPRPFSKQPRL